MQNPSLRGRSRPRGVLTLSIVAHFCHAARGFVYTAMSTMLTATSLPRHSRTENEPSGSVQSTSFSELYPSHIRCCNYHFIYLLLYTKIYGFVCFIYRLKNFKYCYLILIGWFVISVLIFQPIILINKDNFV